jgi:hypothetical protein
MADFYGPAQRRLQDEFDTRRLVDLLIQAIITPDLSPQQIEFIHERNMFFLSTVDEDGVPSSSYKGGARGFVRVPSPYVPGTDGSAKLAMWKRIDIVQDVLTDADRAEARGLGLITVEDYEARVERGELG